MKTFDPKSPLSVALAFALAAASLPGIASAQGTGTAPPPAPAAAEQVLRGKVVYREAFTLPDDAELVVRLLDSTIPNQPRLVAQASVKTAGRQVPISFALPFDPAKATGRVHTLHASIVYGGKTQFVTATRVTIDPKALPDALVFAVVRGDAEPEISDSPAPRTMGPVRSLPPGAQPPVPGRGGPPAKR